PGPDDVRRWCVSTWKSFEQAFCLEGRLHRGPLGHPFGILLQVGETREIQVHMPRPACYREKVGVGGGEVAAAQVFLRAQFFRYPAELLAQPRRVKRFRAGVELRIE